MLLRVHELKCTCFSYSIKGVWILFLMSSDDTDSYSLDLGFAVNFVCTSLKWCLDKLCLCLCIPNIVAQQYWLYVFLCVISTKVICQQAEVFNIRKLYLIDLHNEAKIFFPMYFWKHLECVGKPCYHSSFLLLSLSST